MAFPRKARPLVALDRSTPVPPPLRIHEASNRAGEAKSATGDDDAGPAAIRSVPPAYAPPPRRVVTTSSRPVSSRLRWFMIGAIGMIAWIGLAIASTSAPDRPGENFCYRKAADRFLRGEQFYRTDESRGCFTYPPFMVLPYLPLACLPDRVARAAWAMINLGLLAAIAWLTARLAAPIVPVADTASRLRPWMVAVAIGLLSLRGHLSQLAYQGHDYMVYLFVMLAVSAWATGANFRLGGFAGVAAACKATPLLFLPIFIWQRRWRAAAAMIAGVALATLLPDLLFANPDGGPWVVTWYQKFIAHLDVGAAPEVATAWNLWNALNQSLSGTLYRLFTRVETPGELCWDISLLALDAAALRWLSIAAKLGVLGLLLYCTWPNRLRGLRSGERSFAALGQGGAVLCGMLLLSPMSSVQHFCFLLAPISFLVVDFVYRRRDPLVATTLVMFLISSLTCRDLAGSWLHVQLQAYGHLTWLTLISMAVSAYVLEQRARAARAADERAEETLPPSILKLPVERSARRKAA